MQILFFCSFIWVSKSNAQNLVKALHLRPISFFPVKYFLKYLNLTIFHFIDVEEAEKAAH